MTRAADFAAATLVERASLAIIDPEGEAEAIAPLSAERARQTLRPLPIVKRASAPRSDRDLLDRLGADPGRTSGRIPCPAHGGRDRNLAWRLTPDGRVLLTCHSHHCTFDEIVGAVA